MVVPALSAAARTSSINPAEPAMRVFPVLRRCQDRGLRRPPPPAFFAGYVRTLSVALMPLLTAAPNELLRHVPHRPAHQQRARGRSRPDRTDGTADGFLARSVSASPRESAGAEVLAV